MTTFVLKRYNEQSNQQQSTDENKKAEQEPIKETKISIAGSISEIVAKALITKLSTVPDAVVDQTEGSAESPDISAVAITTEEINDDPVKALRSVQDNANVFIQTEGFHTSKEEWFLMNLSNKTSNVFYTLESFVSHLAKKA